MEQPESRKVRSADHHEIEVNEAQGRPRIGSARRTLPDYHKRRLAWQNSRKHSSSASQLLRASLSQSVTDMNFLREAQRKTLRLRMHDSDDDEASSEEIDMADSFELNVVEDEQYSWEGKERLPLLSGARRRKSTLSNRTLSIGDGDAEAADNEAEMRERLPPIFALSTAYVEFDFQSGTTFGVYKKKRRRSQRQLITTPPVPLPKYSLPLSVELATVMHFERKDAKSTVTEPRLMANHHSSLLFSSLARVS